MTTNTLTGFAAELWELAYHERERRIRTASGAQLRSAYAQLPQGPWTAKMSTESLGAELSRSIERELSRRS